MRIKNVEQSNMCVSIHDIVLWFISTIQVVNVRLHEVIHGETMILWDDVEERYMYTVLIVYSSMQFHFRPNCVCVVHRCILTYEVAMSLEEEGTYTRVNSVNTIFSLYVHQHPGK